MQLTFLQHYIYAYPICIIRQSEKLIHMDKQTDVDILLKFFIELFITSIEITEFQHYEYQRDGNKMNLNLSHANFLKSRCIFLIIARKEILRLIILTGLAILMQMTVGFTITIRSYQITR